MRVAIVQPCYLPWKGYFDLIHSVDHFVFFDDVQYPRARTWRNRNQIIVNRQPKWINVPVEKSPWHRRINEVRIRDPFAESHWQLIIQGYRKAPYFKRYADRIRNIIMSPAELLADLAIAQTRWVCEILGIATPTSLSSALGVSGMQKADLLVEICRQLGATEYVTGPSARDYIDPRTFEHAGIKLAWFRYDYPEYPQMSETFIHQVSVIDLIFNTGPDAPSYIWGSR